MANETETNSSKTLSHLNSYPLLADTYEQVTGYYAWVKNLNSYVNTTLNWAETGAEKVASTAQPLVDRFDKPISSLDSVVASQLEKLESNYPIVKKPTAEVLEDTQKYCSETVMPVVHSAMQPATTVYQFSKKQVDRVIESSALLKNLEGHLTQLYDEWRQEMESAKEGEVEEEGDGEAKKTKKDEGGKSVLAATRHLAENVRLSLAAAGLVLSGRLSEENRTRLANAKNYTDELVASLHKAKTVSDLSESFFTKAKETLHAVQGSLEKAVDYLKTLVPHKNSESQSTEKSSSSSTSDEPTETQPKKEK